MSSNSCITEYKLAQDYGRESLIHQKGVRAFSVAFPALLYFVIFLTYAIVPAIVNSQVRGVDATGHKFAEIMGKVFGPLAGVSLLVGSIFAYIYYRHKTRELSPEEIRVIRANEAKVVTQKQISLNDLPQPSTIDAQQKYTLEEVATLMGVHSEAAADRAFHREKIKQCAIAILVTLVLAIVACIAITSKLDGASKDFAVKATWAGFGICSAQFVIPIAFHALCLRVKRTSEGFINRETKRRTQLQNYVTLIGNVGRDAQQDALLGGNDKT